MNWTVHKTAGQSYVTVVTQGEFNVADHEKMVEDIVSSDFWKPGTDVLFDHRNLQFGLTNYSSMMQASDTHKKHEQQIGDDKAAILMRSLVDFGRGRQFELMTSEKVSAKLRIFLDEKEAVNWLNH
jgi:hypothetical protein